MKRRIKKRAIAIIALVLSTAVLTFVGFKDNQTRAALSVFGNRRYQTDLKTSMVEITAYENDYEFEQLDSLLANFPKNENFKVGAVYQEEISAKNTGSSPEYVRAIVRKYWTDKFGNKITVYVDTVDKNGGKDRTPLDNDFIVLAGGDEGWHLNNAEKTEEVSVYYYEKPINVDEEVTLFRTFKIDNQVYNYYTDTITTGNDGTKTLVRSYLYDGLKYNVEIDFQSLQYLEGNDAVNASAIKSVWGTNTVRVSGAQLSVGN